MNNPKITNWIKVKEFANMCMKTRIKTNQNLIKLVDLQPHTIDLQNLKLDDTLHILDMIDVENAKRIFKNIELFQSIIKQLVANKIEWPLLIFSYKLSFHIY